MAKFRRFGPKDDPWKKTSRRPARVEPEEPVKQPKEHPWFGKRLHGQLAAHRKQAYDIFNKKIRTIEGLTLEQLFFKPKLIRGKQDVMARILMGDNRINHKGHVLDGRDLEVVKKYIDSYFRGLNRLTGTFDEDDR